MATQTGSGLSTEQDDQLALDQAFEQAMASLTAAPRLGFVFCGPNRPLDHYLSSLHEKHPTTDFLGCTTAGELTQEGKVHNGVAVFLISSDKIAHHAISSDELTDDPEGAAETICEEFHELAEKSKKEKLRRSTTIVLADGLSGTGEAALRQLIEETTAFHQIVGGASGDEGAFKQTSVGLNRQCGQGQIAVAHIFSDSDWGIGTGHGLRPASKKMVVTKARGSTLISIDNRPAFDVYKEHAAANGVDLTPENAGPYMIQHELGIFLFDKVAKARAPLAVNEDGSLSLAGEIRTNSAICILDGNVDEMVSAAKQAAEEAKAKLGDRKVAGVMLFDCVCRGLILDQEFNREIEAVKSVFGDVPIGGFLTYGEIARRSGAAENWHNTTAVILAIPE